jgi:excisionase family DNA binding protein
MDTDVTLTVDEAHAILGQKKISRGGFYAAINRNEVPHVRLGHRILIPRHAFTKWLESASQPPTGQAA